MNGNTQPLADLRRLFEHPAGTKAQQCQHPNCERITLGRDCCAKHRAEAANTQEANG